MNFSYFAYQLTWIYFWIIKGTNCDVFTAFVDLENALRLQQKMSGQILNYINKEENRLSELKKIADDFQQHSELGLSDPENFLGNPINSFLLVKRFTHGWQEIERKLRNDTSDLLLYEMQDDLKFMPDETDLTGAIMALIRIQDTYNIPVSTLASGILAGVKTAEALTAADCFELGRTLYFKNDYYHAMLWMDEAANLNDLESPPSVEWPVLYDFFSFSVYKLGDVKRALNLTNKWLSFDPDNVRALENIGYYLRDIEDNAESHKDNSENEFIYKRPLSEWKADPEFVAYEALCRGEKVLTNPKAHKLSCRYAYPHEYYWLRPLKEEQMHQKPDVYIYHDLLTETQTSEIKRIATPKFSRSGVFTYPGQPADHRSETDYRVSKSAWLRDYESPAIRTVSNKVQKLSKLSFDTVEDLQVLNYGIGGQYEPHYDFARPNEIKTFSEESGNRVATAIFYLSDVQAGGATVFTSIGLTLWPEKGSLAFWYNLLENGEGDYNTRHAGCPVLAGSKWACNKWIHIRGQEFHRPCNLDRDL